MIELKNINFQYYPARVDTKQPLGTVTLFEMLKANKEPNDNIKDVFRRIAEAEKNGDLKLKAKLKQENLYYFTPCVFSNGQGRKYTDIVSFTGLLVLDFDHIENATEFKYFLFNKYQCIIAAIISPSKKGVKFIVKIPVVETVDQFKEYFFGIAVEMDKYKGFDGTGQNCILPLFLSYDPDLLFRDNPIEWNKKGQNIKEFKASAVVPVIIDATDQDKASVQKIIKSAVDKIISDGHPQIRAAAVTLGGYVATGYIDQIEAENFINSLIANNSYLSKGTTGYQRTAKTAIQLGTQSQLFLK
jgi:hypothetical protein